MEDVFKKVRSKIVRKGPAATKKNARVSMNQAKRVDPNKYKNYTTKPSDEIIETDGFWFQIRC